MRYRAPGELEDLGPFFRNIDQGISSVREFVQIHGNDSDVDIGYYVLKWIKQLQSIMDLLNKPEAANPNPCHPENQSLESSLVLAIRGIDGILDAIKDRSVDRELPKDRIAEIDDLGVELYRIRLKLGRIKIIK